jgi:hypothetical protein
MKITEILGNIHCYLAVIKIRNKSSNLSVRTVIYADGLYQAKALLSSMYGDGSVILITRITEKKIHEAVAANAHSQSLSDPLPIRYKHNLAKKALLRLMKRNSLKIKPTIDDLKSASNELDVQQKRINREYENKLKWDEIRKK